MKQLCKRSLALIMVLVMLVSIVPAITFQTEAASYTYNWGTRGTVADEDDFTRSTAEEWYAAEGTSYEELSQLLGSATSSSVPSSALYQELRSLMSGAATSTTSYEKIKELCKYTDCQNGGGAISSFYSGNSVGPSWDGTWNREHVWPDSKGDNNGSGENDIFMLRPTSYAENGSRGNTAYGEGSSYYHPNEESNGAYDLRGDVVRIIMFVYVRWQSISSNSTGVLYGTDGVIENRDVMLKWMEEDPVDTWELGRNDSCQSITGTRNVFVDYPELGFLLFGADVPDNYTSPSGQGKSASYNITATSNNTSYGTVSLSGRTITATPKTGYYASGYTVTSGTATVTQNGNTFTVSASSDCTVQINFAQKKTVTVSFAGADVVSQSGYAGESMTLPSVTAPDGYKFLGWMTSSLSSDTTEKPAYHTDSFVPTQSATLYALYSYSEGGSGETEYVLTDLADIGSNDTTVITVTTSSGTVYAMSNDGGTSDAPAGVTVTVSDDGTVLTTAPADNLKWNVGGSADAYIFYPNGDTSQWLYCTAKNNGVRVGTTEANTFKIDSSTGYLMHIGTSRYIGAYTTNPDWRCYTTTGGNIANQTIGFYVLREVGTTYYTGNPVQCDHANTENHAAVAATCTESGYTAGVFCNDCETYISGHTVVAATGHSYGDWTVTTAPTCTAAGVQSHSCAACGATETESVAATGHSYGDWTVTTAPTCTAAGVESRTCASCGNVETQSVAATGHSYVENDFVYTCSSCGDSYAANVVEFSVPDGVAAVEKMEYTDGGITLPEAGVPTGDYAYTFAGWAEETVDNSETAPTIYKAGQTYITDASTTLYAVYTYKVENSEGGSGDYVKVTEAPEDWSGEYVIVYETLSYIFDGSLSKLDATKNYKEVTITDNTISAEEGDPCKFIIAAGEDGYSVQAANGNYIYRAATSNGLNEGSTPYYHTITLDSFSNVKIASSYGPYLNFNAGTDQMRFRYYKSGQKPIQLYVKDGSAVSVYYTTVIGTECGHDNENPVVTKPTCTEQGYTTYYCADCGEELYVEDYVDALGHSYESVVTPPTSTEQGYTTHTCANCGDSYVDSYTEPTGPATPEYDIKFASANMILEADLTFTFWVKPEVMAQYEDIRVEYVIGDKTQVVTESWLNPSNSRSGFNCTGIAPNMIKDTVQATIYGTYDGVEYSFSMEHSAYNYLTGKSVLGSDDASLRTLAVDLLNYGTIHQLYTGYKTDALINADLTDDQKANGTSTVPTLENITSGTQEVVDNPTAKFNSANLILENAVIMRWTLTCDDLTDVSVKIKVAGNEYVVDASEFEAAPGYTNRYYIYCTKLTAIQFREPVDATIYRGETAISNTLRYSVESYAASKQNDESIYYLADIVKAIMVYGDAAYAYIFG